MGSVAEKFYKFPTAFMEAPGISLSAKNVLCVLRHHAYPHDGECHIKQSEIATKLQQSLPTIQRALYELRDAKLITIKKGQRENFFSVTDPSQWLTLLHQFDVAGKSCHINLRQRATSNRCGTTLFSSEHKKEPKKAAVVEATTSVANPSPNAAAAKKNGHQPERKPPRRAVDFTGYSDWTVEEYRVMLAWHAPHLHLPPADDWIVLQVLRATGGAHPNEVHKLMLELHKRHRFETIQSWGLVPVVLKPWFQRRAV